MLNHYFVLVGTLVGSLAFGACSAQSDDDFAQDDAADAPVGADGKTDTSVRPITLRNHVAREITYGPDALRITTRGGKVTASLTDEWLATCVIKEIASESTGSKTVFSFTGEYELDDGWNGCTIEFSSANGFEASLMVGISVE